MGERRVEPLPPQMLRALADPRAYPEDPSAASGVEQEQTHIQQFGSGSLIDRVDLGA